MFVVVYSMSITTRVLYVIIIILIIDHLLDKIQFSLSLSLILSIETLQNQDRRLIAIHRGRAHKSVCAGCKHKRCVSDACERILREHA